MNYVQYLWHIEKGAARFLRTQTTAGDSDFRRSLSKMVEYVRQHSTGP